jgi:hypothetical protein
MTRAEWIEDGYVYSTDPSLDLAEAKMRSGPPQAHPFRRRVLWLIAQDDVFAEAELSPSTSDIYGVYVRVADRRAFACAMVVRSGFASLLTESGLLMDNAVVQHMPDREANALSVSDGLVRWSDRNKFTPVHKHLRFQVRFVDTRSAPEHLPERTSDA